MLTILFSFFWPALRVGVVGFARPGFRAGRAIPPGGSWGGWGGPDPPWRPGLSGTPPPPQKPPKKGGVPGGVKNPENPTESSNY